jgi:formylglycine-generating enzyme
MVSEEQEQIKSPDDLEPGMVYVEGGTFEMGSRYNNEKPVHEVTVKDFYISQYPITVAQYKHFCHETRRRKMPEMSKDFWGWFDDHPMIHVSWEDAKEYCQWKNGRLPTEAEWEFAARGGNKSKNLEYSGSDKVDDIADLKNSQTYPVGKKAANELNLFDMSGNVWEWCMDWYANYHNKPQNNPQGPTEGKKRVQRGGSWRGPTENMLRITNRRGDNPKNQSNEVGFRLVKEQIEIPPKFSDEQNHSPIPPDKPYDSLISSLNTRIIQLEELLNTLNQQVISLKSEIQHKKSEPSKEIPFKNEISSIRERIHSMRLSELEQQWIILNEKRSGLERQNILETRADEIFRLENIIEKINENCQTIEQEIDELEKQL